MTHSFPKRPRNFIVTSQPLRYKGIPPLLLRGTLEDVSGRKQNISCGYLTSSSATQLCIRKSIWVIQVNNHRNCGALWEGDNSETELLVRAGGRWKQGMITGEWTLWGLTKHCAGLGGWPVFLSTPQTLILLSTLLIRSCVLIQYNCP